MRLTGGFLGYTGKKSPFRFLGIVNGDFATGDLTGWTDTSLGAGVATVVANKAVLQRAISGDLERISQAVVTKPGVNYTLTFDISNNNSCFLQVGTTQNGQTIVATSYNIGSQSVSFNATTATTYIAFYCSGVGNENHVDNVVMTET